MIAKNNITIEKEKRQLLSSWTLELANWLVAEQGLKRSEAFRKAHLTRQLLGMLGEGEVTFCYMKANGELVMKDFTKSAYYELVQDYVSSTMLRVARDTFALLPVKQVLIHAVDKVLNPATGNDEEVTIASVKIKRDALATLNFERIDPSDCLESFESNIKFKKTTGYAPVDRVLA